ncbi:QTRT2 ribosyltransferase, partial [Polyodon spathula]|nr:queuine tRNA-ribosyltransferase accessory subunit 2 isoform X1 [Polyodon spathula]XP_041089244.1 queuine tRNA-ribosyltransferase accessory subunit 2 isoform X1 [Polyodon spathula]MBN3273001.1 QTRT2 ribosyltransferase [Polyodon spathula]
MKLDLVKVVSGCRLGVLTNLGKNGDKTLEVPGCLLYTRCGSAPHLTHETLETIEKIPAVAQLTLSTLAEYHEVLEEYKEGAGKFIGMPDSVLYCSLQDPAAPCPPGFITNKTVSVWGSGGRMEMTASKFMALQAVVRPDWFQSMADGETVQEDTSKKRVRKSVDRTLAFLDECLQLQQKSQDLQGVEVLGVVEGGDILEERKRSAKETAKRPVGGFVLDGFQGDTMTKELKLKLISSVTAELPDDKPRLIQGIGRPNEVLDCVEAGVDLFESFFPYQVTERGCALSFRFRYQLDPETQVLERNGPQVSEETRAEKDNDVNDKEEKEPMTPFEMDLKSKRYREDFGPLVQGCLCYCCRNHTRAYVHHLLLTNELLSGVLLMIHNFQHYFGFFHSLRQALREGHLEKLKALVNEHSP